LFLVTFGFSLLIASVALLPSYFLSTVKISSINAKLDAQKREPVPLLDQQTLSIIKDLNNKLSLIKNAEGGTYLVSQKIINAIVLNKVPNIKINDITYDTDGAKGKRISITGIAPNREVLLAFSKALKDSGLFKQVDLPISNFIKGSNIQFSLNLIPA
jgi:Tfp pilus assembly protein PilN